jgi:hypothetical protein
MYTLPLKKCPSAEIGDSKPLKGKVTLNQSQLNPIHVIKTDSLKVKK